MEINHVFMFALYLYHRRPLLVEVYKEPYRRERERRLSKIAKIKDG